MKLNSETCNTPRDAWAQRPTLDTLRSHDIFEFRAAFLTKLLPDVAGLDVVEVGSGPAHDSLSFADRGAHVTAVDCSATGLEIAKEIYTAEKHELTTRLADARDLPFDDNSFDIAFNAGVLEHFNDDELEKVIDEMIRVVKPGGTVLAFCPNRFNVFYQTHLKRVESHSYDFERSFSAGELRKRFLARGLGEVHVSGVHVHPAPNYLLPPDFPKIHKIEPFCRKVFSPLEKIWGLHTLKALIGQDFVVWATVPVKLYERRPIGSLRGGPAVRDEAGEPRLAA